MLFFRLDDEKNVTGWSTQEPQNSSVSVSPLLTLSKWTVKNTIKRRKIGLVKWLREGWNIFNGTPVDIEETTFFSKGCLLDAYFITSTWDVFHGMPFGGSNHALGFNLTWDCHEKMQNDVWNEGILFNYFLKKRVSRDICSLFLSRQLEFNLK